ncbi:MAG: hypothetical protein ACK2UK_17870 [Candidatus Promineifilaceae bacterium]
MNELAEKGRPHAGTTFGGLVRTYRRQCQDPLRGGLLTQERLGELIGDQMGDAGYTGAAVSEWERGRSKIHADDRLVLLALLKVLVQCGGIQLPRQADNLLEAGNYRSLNARELTQLFPDLEPLSLPEPAQNGAKKIEEGAKERDPRQQILLNKVKEFWVSGVLEKSRQAAPVFEIPQTFTLDAVDHPWHGSLGHGLLLDETHRPRSIYRSYRRADGALLILGGPGAGKTTMLITLANALIERARASPREPVPAILDLSSWAQSSGHLAEWVVEEIAAKYQVPQRYGRKWLSEDDLILLLDGLDTLPIAVRRSCIVALNEFHLKQGLTGIAVCCRTKEYEESAQLLSFSGALLLEPLEEKQLTAFITQSNDSLIGLEAAWAAVPGLRELAQNPLMLNMMAVVFSGADRQLVRRFGDEQDASSVEMLFDAYVQRMFAQHAAHGRYEKEQSLQWLAWLAGRMNAHNQTIFLIEQIQPSWLPGKRWRRLYMILAGLITGTAGGLIMWLLWRLLRYTIPQLPAPTSAFLSSLIGIPMGTSEPLTIMLGNLGLGFILAAILIILFEKRSGTRVDLSLARRYRRRQMIVIGLVTGIVTTLFVLLFTEPLLAVAWGVAEGFMYGFAARYVFGWNYATEVQTVEALGWSWKHAGIGALLGLALAVVAEAIESLLFGYNGAARTVITLLTAGFILGGLRGRSVQTKTRPNQGVWLSLRNALIAAAVVSTTLAGLAWVIRDETYAWQIAILSAIIAASLMGVSVVVKHFVLRAILRYRGVVPWRYAQFLDYAAQLVLLRRVGNGYIFLHGLMQSYFAERA